MEPDTQESAAREAWEALRHELLDLYIQAGRPSLRQISAATQGHLSHESVRRILQLANLPKWKQLSSLVEALQGEPADLWPHWTVVAADELRQGDPASVSEMKTANGPVEKATHAEADASSMPDYFDDDWTLYDFSFFGELSRNERRAIEEASRTVSFSDDSILSHQGQNVEVVAIVLHGHVKLSSQTPEGWTSVIDILGPGDIHGDVDLMTSGVASASAHALGHTSCAIVRERKFQSLLAKQPGIMSTLLRASAVRLRRAEQLRGIAQSPARQAVAQVIVMLAQRFSITEPSFVIDVPLSHGDLAGLAGKSLATCERALRTLRDDGIIQTGYRRLIVGDYANLVKVARGEGLGADE